MVTAQPYMPVADRRCGTCLWLTDVDAERIGSCAAPLPGVGAAAVSARKREQLGTCCACGYSGEEETECPARKDRCHCVHWWDAPPEPEAKPRRTAARPRR